MKLNLLSALIATALLALPCAHAAKVERPSAPGTAVQAPAEAREKKDAAEASAKNLSKEEHARRNAALEKADTDPAVAEAKAKADEAQKKYVSARRAKDAAPESVAAAKKEADAAHDAYVKARRASMAKTDPEAAKLDERAFAVGERLRDAREAKEQQRDQERARKGVDAPREPGRDPASGLASEPGEPKGRGKGKGREHAPGQMKKELGGEATDHAPGKTKEKKGKKGKGSDEE